AQARMPLWGQARYWSYGGERPGAGQVSPLGPSGPDIRPHRPEDDEAILAAYREAIAEGRSFPPSEPPTMERMHEVWLKDKSIVLTAELEGLVAGCCYVQPNFPGRARRIANAGYLVAGWARG